MPGIHIEHFGCRAARADGEAIGGRLRALSEIEPLATDVVVVNTCSVTAEADRAARAFIRRTHRESPAAKIVVTGCYAQRAPDELAAMAGVAAVVGNSHKALAPEIIFALAGREDRSTSPGPALISAQSLLLAFGAQTSAPIWADDHFAHSFIEDVHLAPGAQTRPNLKIQEGCGNRCTFCVIPFTRGPSRSLPGTTVIERVNRFVAAGGNELVLSGINLGRWGRDFSGSGRETLAGLVRLIFEQTLLPRLRLSSIEPMDWDEELIGIVREFGGSRLARHAHLPLQSGSDAVLRRMHRRYRPWHYADKVAALLRAAGPGPLPFAVADVMPLPAFQARVPVARGLMETPRAHHCARPPLGYLHLFPFSPPFRNSGMGAAMPPNRQFRKRPSRNALPDQPDGSGTSGISGSQTRAATRKRQWDRRPAITARAYRTTKSSACGARWPPWRQEPVDGRSYRWS